MPDAPFVDVLYELTFCNWNRRSFQRTDRGPEYTGQMDRYFYHVSWKNRSADTGAAVVSRAQKRTKDVHLAEENIMIG